ncbi:MAG: hypothetical protein KBG15_07680, partial [Kofleriaceae bacterium]|nr:hypothetical protein [Kofleriaceae bacterium]
EQAPTKAARDGVMIESEANAMPYGVRAVAGEIGETSGITRDAGGPDDDMSTAAMQRVDPGALIEDSRHADELEADSDAELEEISAFHLVEPPRPPVRVSTPPPFRGQRSAPQGSNDDAAVDADTGEVNN